MPRLSMVSPSGAVTATTPRTMYRRKVIVECVMKACDPSVDLRSGLSDAVAETKTASIPLAVWFHFS